MKAEDDLPGILSQSYQDEPHRWRLGQINSTLPIRHKKLFKSFFLFTCGHVAAKAAKAA